MRTVQVSSRTNNTTILAENIAHARLHLAVWILVLATIANGAWANGEQSKIGASELTAVVRESAGESLADLMPIRVQIDKDSIALKSAAKFAISNGRPVLYWRPEGQADWIVTKAGDFVNLKQDANRCSFRVAFGQLHVDMTIAKCIEDRVWRFSGALTNDGDVPVEAARFHYLSGNVPSGTNFLELSGSKEQPQLRSGQSSVPIRAEFEQFWSSMGVKWPRLPEPIHDEVGWFASSDNAAFLEAWNTPGWGFGFVGPGNAFGEIGYRGQSTGPEVFVAVLLDGVTMDPKETRTLEECVVWCGDWQSGMNVAARVAACDLQVKKPGAPPVGYCSWYQLMNRVSPDDLERASREFAVWPIPPGKRLIQLDDGFQVQPGNWDPNDRFKAAWPGLAKRIADTGSTPGLWLAPTTVHESSPIVKQHPDWLQRLSNGEPAIRFNNWGPTYYLDPDHPGARAYIRGLLKRFCDEGWKYFKLDFTYPVTAARARYDRKKTEFQTLRDLYVLFREAVGPDVMLNACASVPFRYALGQVDVARLGGDISYHFDAVRTGTRQILTRTATNGVWLCGDPDCFSMRTEQSGLSGEEKRVLTGTIGLFGGTFLTSDWATQWTPSESDFVRQFWNERGPRVPQRQYVVWSNEGEVIAYRVSYSDGGRPSHCLAVYNWGDAPHTIRVSLTDAHFNRPGALRIVGGSDPSITLHGGILSVADQPAHSVRIVGLSESK
jgi:hypothetical protein